MPYTPGDFTCFDATTPALISAIFPWVPLAFYSTSTMQLGSPAKRLVLHSRYFRASNFLSTSMLLYFFQIPV
ncbi:hypothetical protein PsYK624_114580 [Phanerochaete sordida]|uniref:Uncharacterized protein n=1 Tax=Phanerochaete sordida TaxID=48140 RepID=A0A9P3LHF6_9APHY|nr:hypothetical protein PsYK624_114580 [Phanerochaete sordida]